MNKNKQAKKTKIEKGYIIVEVREDGYRKEHVCNYGYNLALSWAKDIKKQSLYTGVSRRVRLFQINKANNEILKAYPEIDY